MELTIKVEKVKTRSNRVHKNSFGCFLSPKKIYIYGDKWKAIVDSMSQAGKWIELIKQEDNIILPRIQKERSKCQKEKHFNKT